MPQLISISESAVPLVRPSCVDLVRARVNKVLVIRSLLSMAQAVATQRIHVTMLGLENQTAVVALDDGRQTVELLPEALADRRTILSRFHDAIVLAKVLRSERPGIVHVNALSDLLVTFGVVHLTNLRASRPAIIAMSHCPETWTVPWRAWLAAKAMRLFADGVVSLATTHTDRLVNLGIARERIVTIPNPYDMELMRSRETMCRQSPSPGAPPRIAYVAGICRRKAQDVLIRAASLIVREYPDVHFDLVGGVLPGESAYSSRLHEITAELKLGDRVHFVGAVNHQKVMALLANSAVVAFPSRGEMMPRGVIEAMSLGKPVVASAVDGIRDLIQNGTSGILVRPDSVGELAQALCALLGNSATARSIGMAGQRRVMEVCSPYRVGKSYRDFCESIVNGMTLWSID